MPVIDMSGRVCGELTVIGRAISATSKVKWLCHCSCGKQTAVDGAKLRSGHTRTCGSCGALRRPALDRFLARITQDGDCWLWTGGLNGVGYGQFFIGGAGTGKCYAHRWSYEFHIGPIPEGLHLDHLCRNRACVNPWHLEPVTLRENVLRGVSKAALNALKTHCPKGHPLAGDNLSIGSKGERRCRECARVQSRNKYWSDPDKYRAFARTYKARKAS